MNWFIGVIVSMALNFSLHSSPITVSSEGVCQIDGVAYPLVDRKVPLMHSLFVPLVELLSPKGERSSTTIRALFFVFPIASFC